MQSRGKLAVAIAIAAAFFGYQFLIHKVSLSGHLTAVSAALVLIPFVIALTWFIAAELGLRLALAITATLIVLGLAAVKLFGQPHPAIIFGMPHLVTNSFLMWFFARTLKNKREPLITLLARSVHGTLTPDLEMYTRHVTFAWSLFFALQIAGSILLFLFASLETWSTFINILNSPLIVLMFLCEYTYRVLRYRNHRSSLFDGLKIFSDGSSASKSAKVR
ncbi:MAG: hypothetical protein A3K04_12540 [Gallionellales bacterium RBG_16_56_9]|nr:MAG: hypothetical protein A3K04_12540 [Gallionellales bacterium RBG_16_56_9]